MANTSSTTYYADYLRLSHLLSCQKPLSGDGKKPAHDEMLFIIVHQAYELWFKLCLFELDSVLETFGHDSVDEKQVGIAVARLQRIIEIQNLLIEQLRVLETMTALDFLDFRDVLYPASGFQSFQFRLLENKLGMLPDQRLLYNREVYYSHLAPEHQRLIQESEKGPSLFALIERWLERTPFVDFHGFDFWRLYRRAVDDMLAGDRKAILANALSSQAEKESQLREVDTNQENFEAILNEDKHRALIDRGLRRLSHRATKAALLIELYRDEPILHMPFQLLTALMDIDEHFNAWRYRHALMVHRMIGNKIGTGGSTGYGYLRATIDKYKVFADLFNLSTFLIPRSRLPELPEEVKKNLGFYYSRLDS